MTGHPALSPCSTGGSCSVSDRVPPVVRGMREKDGRCVGCGRAVVDAVTVVEQEIAAARDLAGRSSAPTISGPEGAPVDVPASRGSEPTTSGPESDPAAAALRATSTEGLVDAVVQITHQIHGCLEGKHDERARDLRAQRALVKAEIVRRAS